MIDDTTLQRLIDHAFDGLGKEITEVRERLEAGEWVSPERVSELIDTFFSLRDSQRSLQSRGHLSLVSGGDDDRPAA